MNDPRRGCADCPLRSRRHLPRRTLLIEALFALVLVAFWPLRAFGKKLAIRLDQVPRLKRVGGYVVLRVKGREILFIRDGHTSVRAVHAICTHKKSRLKYDAAKHKIRCPNHGSLFSFDGKVLKGPAKKDLKPIYWVKLDLDKGRILLRL